MEPEDFQEQERISSEHSDRVNSELDNDLHDDINI